MLIEAHILYRSLEQVPAVLRVRVVVRRGVPRLNIAGHAQQSIKTISNIILDRLRDEQIHQYQKISLTIENPIQYNINANNILNHLYNLIKDSIQAYLKLKDYTPRVVFPNIYGVPNSLQKDIRNLYLTQKNTKEKSNHQLILTTNLPQNTKTLLETKDINKKLINFLFKNNINIVESNNILWIRPNIKIIQQLALFPYNSFSWGITNPPIKIIPYITAISKKFHNIIILAKPCPCGGKFTSGYCTCSKPILYKHLNSYITPLLESLKDPKLLLYNNGNITPMIQEKLHGYYI